MLFLLILSLILLLVIEGIVNSVVLRSYNGTSAILAFQ